MVLSNTLLGAVVCLITCGGGSSQSVLRVVSTSPPGGATAVMPNTAIDVRFDQPVSLPSLQGRMRVFGRWSGVVPGSLALDAAGTTVTFRPLRPFFPAEAVRIELPISVTSASGAGLAAPFFSSFWIRPAPGSGSFVQRAAIPLRRPGELALTTYGINAGDIDGDGSPDICAANEFTGDLRVLHNSGLGSFGPIQVYGVGPGQQPSPSEGADFDGDGWFDIVTGNGYGNGVSVLLGDRQGGFGAPAVFPTGNYVHGVTVFDVEGDGDTDVIATATSGMVLLRNDGTGTFGAPAGFSVGPQEDNVMVADANGDFIADLIVGHAVTVSIALGDGLGGFTRTAWTSVGGRAFQIAVGDVDADGDLDVACAIRITDQLGILLGDGSGGLAAPALYPTGNLPAAVDLGDLDGDGDLDCVVSCYGTSELRLYWNDGSGTFSAGQSLPMPGAGSCATLVDFDRDGDTDIIGTDEIRDQAVLFEQVGPDPSGVQAPSAAASLRVNSWGGRSGFGGAAATPVPLGGDLFVGVSGHPNSVYALVVGLPLEPGVPTPFGTLNLNPTWPPILLVNGIPAGPATDAHGEALFRLRVPTGLATGFPLTILALVADAPSGFVFSNPETVVFVP